MTSPLTENPSLRGQRKNDTIPRILAFEMQIGGHHPSYIRNIAKLWAQRQLPARIEFLVTPAFLQDHSDVVEEVGQRWPDRIEIVSITEAEHQRIESAGWRREFEGWKTFCQYARRKHADHGVLMYSDHFQLPLLFGQTSPCPMSCVYFRPTFHYSQWLEHQSDWKQWIAGTRKKLLLKQVLKVKQLKYLFCLDEFVPDYIDREFDTHVRPLTLPDSFVRHETSDQHVQQLRQELGIDPGRTILLLLGIMDSRKGPEQLLDAALRLPTESQRKLCLLLVGKLAPAIEDSVMQKVHELRSLGAAQVVMHNEYVSDTFVQHYYELADVALTTYQQHKGMSSALVRAGLAGVPVLSSSYGLMGEIVRRHKLGITVDTANPENFASGLDRAVNGQAATAFDPGKSLAFADQHSPDALGDTLEDWVARIRGIAAAAHGPAAGDPTSPNR